MVRRTLVIVAFLALGWAVGSAQTQLRDVPAQPREIPDFELKVTSTSDGRTKIECVQGCGLQWIERQTPHRVDAKQVFSFGCFNQWDKWTDGCPSGRLGGWIAK